MKLMDAGENDVYSQTKVGGGQWGTAPGRGGSDSRAGHGEQGRGRKKACSPTLLRGGPGERARGREGPLQAGHAAPPLSA